MYEVEVRIYDIDPTRDLEAFFDQTKNFGKKFYCIDKNEHHNPNLRITALAVSRDVSYILRWKIRCKQLMSRELDDEGDMIPDMIDKTFPLWGLEPSNRDSFRCYFPNAHSNVKEYTDTFFLHGFIYAEKLMKDGRSLE